MRLLISSMDFSHHLNFSNSSVSFSSKRLRSDLVGFVEVGASPRASIGLAQASKAHAFIQGRAYVTPEDVKAVAMEVLRHRIILNYEAEAEEVSAETVVQKILDGVEVP